MALYEQNQVLPLPLMYGKNLVFKTAVWTPTASTA